MDIALPRQDYIQAFEQTKEESRPRQASRVKPDAAWPYDMHFLIDSGRLAATANKKHQTANNKQQTTNNKQQLTTNNKQQQPTTDNNNNDNNNNTSDRNSKCSTFSN